MNFIIPLAEKLSYLRPDPLLWEQELDVRPEVADAFSGWGSNIIIVDGYDLAQILEGSVDLREALKLKIEKATREGRAFVSLAEFRR